MSQVIVKFKECVDYCKEAEHAVVDICDVFGYCSPWFNDDAWLEDDNRTLVIGSGYSRPPTMDELLHSIMDMYGSVIDEIYEIDYEEEDKE